MAEPIAVLTPTQEMEWTSSVQWQGSTLPVSVVHLASEILAAGLYLVFCQGDNTKNRSISPNNLTFVSNLRQFIGIASIVAK